MGVGQMITKKNKHERLSTIFHDFSNSPLFITSVLYGDYPSKNKAKLATKNGRLYLPTRNMKIDATPQAYVFDINRAT